MALSSAGPVLLVALGAAAVTLLAGATVLLGRAIDPRRVHLLLGATAGLLLAIALTDLVPEAIELAPAAPTTLALGVLALFLVKWITGGHEHGHGPEGHHEAHGEGHGHAHGVAGHATRLAVLAGVALGFHRLVDGFVLPAALGLEDAAGTAAAAAILLHQFPDGVAAATIFLAAGWRRARAARSVALLAAMTPLGAAAGLAVAGVTGLAGHLVALAAASFVFIALAELLPELQDRKYRGVVAVGFVLGYAAAFGLELVVHGIAG